MPSQQLHNYLRTHRKRVGFTQRDIAFLIGSNQTGKISRYETFDQIPHLTTVLAYEVIFQTPPRELFGGLFDKVAEEILKRSEALIRETNLRRTSRRTQAKIDHLKRLAAGNGK